MSKKATKSPDAEPPVDAVDEADEAEVEEDLVASLESQVRDLTDRVARARADYVNLQKRHERDAVLERERVKARVLEHFLQIYEYGRMAAVEAEKEPGPLAEGVKMIVREFDRLLESEGVAPVGAIGEPFDGTLHEAIAEEPADSIEAGCITRVVAPGYRLGDRVLRYARVAVAPRHSEGQDSS